MVDLVVASGGTRAVRREDLVVQALQDGCLVVVGADVEHLHAEALVVALEAVPVQGRADPGDPAPGD